MAAATSSANLPPPSSSLCRLGLTRPRPWLDSHHSTCVAGARDVDDSTRFFVVAAVSGAVAAVLAYLFIANDFDLGLALGIWGVVTFVVLPYVGVAASGGPLQDEPHGPIEWVQRVLSDFGPGAFFGGCIGVGLGWWSGENQKKARG